VEQVKARPAAQRSKKPPFFSQFAPDTRDASLFTGPDLLHVRRSEPESPVEKCARSLQNETSRKKPRNLMRSVLPAATWSVPSRIVVFLLAATSIWCLLSEFYGLCTMQWFTFAILIPATAALLIMAVADRARGEGALWRGVVIGAAAGLVAACVYDLFRLPFVLAAVDGFGPEWLRLPLFKVFPRFGAMILDQPFDATTTDSQFTLAAHLVGWIYHFSNGITFGVMYMALVGEAARRSWLWAVLFATGLELLMLATPYTSFFGIQATAAFVIATFAAHTVFGVALGLAAKWLAERWPARPMAA
jgi:hypothetical protein